MTELKTDSSSQWVQFDALVDQGQYASLADYLFQFQATIEGTNQSELKNLTAAALQICLFCQQCRNEIEWHEKANREIQDRLHDLERQLCALLKSIVDYQSAPDTADSTVSVSVTLLQDRITSAGDKHPTLWQRIRDLFNFEYVPPNPEGELSRVAVDVRVNTPVEKVVDLGYVEKREVDLPAPPVLEDKPDLRINSDERESPAPMQEGARWLEQIPETAKSAPGIQPAQIDTPLSLETAALAGETPPSLMVHCLGPFRVYQDDQLIAEWQSSKGKAIFKYLVTHRHRPVAKEILMELFWPEASPDAARNNLNVAIYGLRQALRESHPSYSHILYRDESYLLNPQINIWLDSEWFSQQIAQAREREQAGDLGGAIELYNNAEALWLGEFLEEDRYEDWPLAQRQLLTEQYLNLLDRLSRYDFEEGGYRACITACRKMLAVDSCREEAHRMMMRCYQLQGQPYLALRQYQQCDEALKTELQVAPTAETKELYKLIRSQLGR